MLLVILLHLPGVLAECLKSEYSPENERFTFHLPELPYEYKALEPVLWSQIVYFHHQKEHMKYIVKLNELTTTNEAYLDLTITELLISYGLADQQLAIYAGGHYNHALLWWVLLPTACQWTEPQGDLLEDITEEWGSFAAFKGKFSEFALSLFGTGWVWLCTNRAEDLRIVGMKNEYSPLAAEECYPFLGIDMWEHSYYLYYFLDNAEWVEAWWRLIDWKLVEYWYEEYASKGLAVPV